MTEHKDSTPPKHNTTAHGESATEWFRKDWHGFTLVTKPVERKILITNFETKPTGGRRE